MSTATYAGNPDNVATTAVPTEPTEGSKVIEREVGADVGVGLAEGVAVGLGVGVGMGVGGEFGAKGFDAFKMGTKLTVPRVKSSLKS